MRRALAVIAFLVAAGLAAPRPAAACTSAYPPAEAHRVSGEDGTGLRPWWYVIVAPWEAEEVLGGLVLRRVRPSCRAGRICRGEEIAIERVGVDVRPAVALRPGRYQLATAYGGKHGRLRWLLADLTVTGAGHAATAPLTAVTSWIDYRDTCNDGTPEVYVRFDDWPKRADALRGRVALVYDREPDPTQPLAGVVKVVPITDQLMQIRWAYPNEPWKLTDAPVALWVALADDDGVITTPIRARMH